MKLTTTAEQFCKNRLLIGEWLLANSVAVEVHFYPCSQKVRFLFDNTKDAMRLVEAIEGL
ncbi:hypothetical protein [Caballeronia zhejiangensis]|uniref:hypothetical protein n=1 Tax=Caballeronia zhejiangensis TaxID=871203 RepID=UPI001F528786|nr:hypothetical protein [Caballeronia zhejiangensis]MCI1046938.1 hypothetical protein [Caballeronia zhejiangensis]